MSKKATHEEDRIGTRVGLLGELEVEKCLVEKGWHPVRLDTAQMASNADLLAVNRKHRVSIQVKTTNAFKKHSHSQSLFLARSDGYLKEGKSFFNSKNSSLIADVVVGVSYYPQKSRFVVLPIGLAEKLCQFHCDYWSSRPTRTESGKRSTSFPLYLCFSKNPEAHKKHHEQVKRNLLKFENAWDVLLQEPEMLRNRGKWHLLK